MANCSYLSYSIPPNPRHSLLIPLHFYSSKPKPLPNHTSPFLLLQTHAAPHSYLSLSTPPNPRHSTHISPILFLQTHATPYSYLSISTPPNPSHSLIIPLPFYSSKPTPLPTHTSPFLLLQTHATPLIPLSFYSSKTKPLPAHTSPFLLLQTLATPCSYLSLSTPPNPCLSLLYSSSASCMPRMCSTALVVTDYISPTAVSDTHIHH